MAALSAASGRPASSAWPVISVRSTKVVTRHALYWSRNLWLCPSSVGVSRANLNLNSNLILDCMAGGPLCRPQLAVRSLHLIVKKKSLSIPAATASIRCQRRAGPNDRADCGARASPGAGRATTTCRTVSMAGG
eukprot:357838-Chlamydomonas_euryale.AAC.11